MLSNIIRVEFREVAKQEWEPIRTLLTALEERMEENTKHLRASRPILEQTRVVMTETSEHLRAAKPILQQVREALA